MNLNSLTFFAVSFLGRSLATVRRVAVALLLAGGGVLAADAVAEPQQMAVNDGGSLLLALGCEPGQEQVKRAGLAGRIQLLQSCLGVLTLTQDSRQCADQMLRLVASMPVQWRGQPLLLRCCTEGIGTMDDERKLGPGFAHTHSNR
jgi:HrpA-like RNA helicase